MPGGKREDIILLSISPKFAEEIFSRKKDYEFRKPSLPSEISYVLLMESGTRDILGGFKVGAVIESTVDELWKYYAKDTSEKGAFYRYYEGWGRGLAIEVGEPDEFDEPLAVDELTELDPNLQVPDQFSHIYLTTRAISVLTNHSEVIQALFPITTLDEWVGASAREEHGQGPDLQIREMQPSEEGNFQRLVAELDVPETCREVGATSCEEAISAHDNEAGGGGYFAEDKTVYSFVADQETVGFSAISWERPGTVRYGPTVLEEDHRERGLGPKFRRKLDERLESEGVHKTYSIIPETATHAQRDLVESGYTVEAHRPCPSGDNPGELVFGKVLGEQSDSHLPEYDRSGVVDVEFDVGAAGYDGLTEFVTSNGDPWVADGGELLVETAKQVDDGGLFQAGTRVYLGHDDGEIQCCAFATRRQGGEIELAPVMTAATGSVVTELVAFAEDEVAKIIDVQKFYARVPLSDAFVVHSFKSAGYSVEGVLREHQKPGEDLVCLGKMPE